MPRRSLIARPYRTPAALVAVLLAVLASAALPPAVSAAAQAQRDSPRMQRVEGFVGAFNSGDPATLVAFLRDNATPEWLGQRSASERLDLFGRVMGDLGKVEIEGVQFDGRATVTIRAAAERIEDAVTFELVFEEAEPHRIAGLGIDVTPGLPEGLPELPDLGDLDETARAALDRYFRDLVSSDLFSGTVLIALDGRPVFEGAYGLADRSWEVPNEMGTRFDVGSINKDFTKVAVGQLLAAGKLSLDDRVLDLLPDYPNPEVAGRITVRQLLTHTSGLGDIFSPEFLRANKALHRANEDYFDFFADKPLLFEPGTDRRYSNGGYIVLGAIVARLSGMPYAEYVERHVFAPAGMSGAAFAARDRVVHDVAVPYTRQSFGPSDDGPEAEEEVGLHPSLFVLPVVGMGAGSSVATAADLLAFDRALREHRLLDARYTEWFFTGQLPAATEDAVGDALMAWPIGAAGGAPGVNAILEGDARHTVVVLSNLDPPAAEALGIEISRQLGDLDSLAKSAHAGDGPEE